MNENVVRPQAWQNEQVGEGAEAPAPDLYASVDEVPAKDPQFGETVLGELTDEEAELYLRLANVTPNVEALEREIQGYMLEQVGRSFRTSKDDLFKIVAEMPDTTPPQMMAEFFRGVREREYLRETFYWRLGERFGVHDYALGVRSKRRAVRGKRKWGSQ